MPCLCINRDVENVAPQTAIASPLARRELLEWRDRHKLASTLGLARCWQDLKPSINERIEQISWYDAAVSPSTFIKNEIDPMIIEGISATGERLISDAQDELRQIVEQQLTEIATVGSVQSESNSLQDATQILSSIAPLAGGLALGAALPGMAVVSGTAAFGLVATSTVSMPILIGGLALAGGAVATGVVKTSQLRAYRSRSIRKRIEDHVAQAVLSRSAPAIQSSSTSVLYQIHQAIEAASSKALENLA